MLCLLFTSSIIATVGAASPTAPTADAIPWRGIVEGFYGTPWSQTDRLSTLQFMGNHHMNIYIYAPKDDPYHREKWRAPYPAADMQRIQALIRTAQENHVEFVFAISPGLDMEFTGDKGQHDLKSLLAKLNSLYDLGIRQFAIFFDDITNKDGLRQAQVLNTVNREFVHQKPQVKPLFTVPTEYFSQDMLENGHTKPYTKAFASSLDKDIIVMYCGPGVVCEGISCHDITAIEQIYGRKMAVWWNYPVSDYRQGKLALGPVVGLEAAAATHMAALLMNPMEHATMSRIALATGADYAASPQAYSPEASWNKALQEQYGSLAGDMKVFADHSQRMNNSWAHTGRADAPLMKQHISALWQAVTAGHTIVDERNALRQDCEQTIRAVQHLQASLDPVAYQESHKQLALLQQLTEADQTALLLIQAELLHNTALTDSFYNQLINQKQALPDEKQAVISEQTAAALITDTINWYNSRHK